MGEFQVVADFEPRGDQPKAIKQLARGSMRGCGPRPCGITGSGKTFTISKVIEAVQKPTLVIAHNKTLAAQLYSEFKEFFPDNAVHYFVSYYDYYQPEAYVPQTDTYIEKDASINDEIDRLRHAATSALFERRDVIIVASVSCIYGLGSPEDYLGLTLSLKHGDLRDRDKILRRLVAVQYQRNDVGFTRGTFRVRGDVVEIIPVYNENIIRLEFFGDEIDRIVEVDPITGELLGEKEAIAIYPASHYVTTEEKMQRAIVSIEQELEEQLKYLGPGTNYWRPSVWSSAPATIWKCSGRSATVGDRKLLPAPGGAGAGEAPATLLDYFPTTSCWSSMRATRPSPRSGPCAGTAPGKRPWWNSASGCLRPWTTGR